MAFICGNSGTLVCVTLGGLKLNTLNSIKKLPPTKVNCLSLRDTNRKNAEKITQQSLLA